MVGTYDGRCIFYSTDQLKYHTMINARSTRGKNSEGRKVTGIEQMPGEDKVRAAKDSYRDIALSAPLCLGRWISGRMGRSP